MKVAFTSLFRRGMGGGAGRVAHELADHFAQKHEVVMICPADETGLNQESNQLRVFGIRSAGDDAFHMPELSTRTIGELFDFLDEFQPDVVHAHDPALVGLVGQIWARMNLVPFVHTAHVLPSKALDFGTTDAINVKWLKSSFSSSLTTRVLGDFYHNCDAIIALNQPAKISIRDFGYQGRIYQIPNGRALSHYQTCQFANPDAKQKQLTFIGYISDRKNQAYLLKILKHLPKNYHLRLVGKPLSEEYLGDLKRYCTKHNLDNVEFIGQVEHQEIPQYLEDTHVFPSASKMEVQSLVVIEALASGTPVVGLSNETIDELVDQENGVWLAKETKPAWFADQIERICNQTNQKYIEMCQKARDRVSHLDWRIIVDQTVSAYREIQQIIPSVTEEESDMLVSLVSFLTRGEVQEYLLEIIDDTRKRSGAQWGLQTQKRVFEKMKSFTRVPSSTWLISGITILLSVVGYLFMKGKGKQS